jgi:cytidylate kinase
LDGQDVTRALRNPEVDAVVSIVAAFPRVRRAMVAQQRRIASGRQSVIVGRDIGTVVMPDADLKIYLDASLEARAARRHLELTQRNVASRYSDVLEGLRRRDRLDSSRADSPLRPARDAVILDSTELSAEETLAQAIALVEARNAALAPHQSAP